MKIIVLQGSPDQNGSTQIIAEAFARGAGEAGHEVEIIQTADVIVHPCMGCLFCEYEGPCIQKDDMGDLRVKILQADMLVFATPLYYYGMTAQLKTVIDRFCAFNNRLQRKHMKSALLATAWDEDDWAFEALKTHYKTLVRYLNFDDQGEILGYGCGTPSMTKHSGYVKDAYDLGRRLL